MRQGGFSKQSHLNIESPNMEVPRWVGKALKPTNKEVVLHHLVESINTLQKSYKSKPHHHNQQN